MELFGCVTESSNRRPPSQFCIQHSKARLLERTNISVSGKPEATVDISQVFIQLSLTMPVYQNHLLNSVVCFPQSVALLCTV